MQGNVRFYLEITNLKNTKLSLRISRNSPSMLNPTSILNLQEPANH